MVICALAGAGPASWSSCSAGTSAPGMRGRTTVAAGRASAALMQRLRTPHAAANRRPLALPVAAIACRWIDRSATLYALEAWRARSASAS
uniref:Uncharacterized protein n=1 Tax=Triticum urartu TaxID=4572 RepID=A0A8R7V426_TRIUA